MRLIDADALTKEIKMDVEDVGLQERKIFYRINDAQTIDAVEVVRCKDCIHWFPHTQCGFDEDNDEYHDYCGLLTPDDDYYAFRRKSDDYCSYGERRNP